MRNIKIGDYVKLEWLDTVHKDDLTLNEAKQLKPSKSISYGKLIWLDDDYVVVVGTIFPDDEGDEYRDVSSIPRSIVSKIIRLKEVI
ncbi:hypothetical protein ES707_07376 [subsurface metagenome]